MSWFLLKGHPRGCIEATVVEPWLKQGVDSPTVIILEAVLGQRVCWVGRAMYKDEAIAQLGTVDQGPLQVKSV